MNGTQIQAQIYAGYGKTAKRIGFPYAHYRADSPLDALNDSNRLDDIFVAFSTLTRPFVATAKWSDETMLCWADGRQLAPRDILVGPDGTFYIGDMGPQLPIQVVRCTHVAASITRSDPTLGVDAVVVASNLPICLKLKSVNVKPLPGAGAASTGGIGISNWLAFIPMAEATLKRNDIIIDGEGVQYEVDAPSWTPMGYVAQVRLANP
jgi:hypothetical protein